MGGRISEWVSISWLVSFQKLPLSDEFQWIEIDNSVFLDQPIKNALKEDACSQVYSILYGAPDDCAIKSNNFTKRSLIDDFNAK